MTEYNRYLVKGVENYLVDHVDELFEQGEVLTTEKLS